MKVANALPQKRAIAEPWTFMTSPPQLDGGRPLILVAEDEAIIAFELEDSLKAAGFDIAGPFATCADAQRWLKTGRPTAAILDNALKDGPCDALARDLKACGVPVIIFSGLPKGQDAFSTSWDGPWLIKPMPFPAVLQTLQSELAGSVNTAGPAGARSAGLPS